MPETPIPRLSRLTAILLKLQAQPYVSVKALANSFGVHTRTIYRDIRALEEAGVPIAAEEGRGFTLVQGFNLPPVMFSESEANALLTAEKFIAKTKDASLIAEFGKAIDKIKAVLRPEEKEKSELLAARTIIGKNWQDSRTSNDLADIQRALTHRQVLRIDYRKKEEKKPMTRDVEPFAIYHNTAENWVLIAWCRLRDDWRTFRVDRIEQLQPTRETFPAHQLSLEEYVALQREKYGGGDPVT